jgi:hypothetical protein
MSQRHLFFGIAILILAAFAAGPVLAATTAVCPSSCSCLLPAEAAKINTPGLCGGKQILCESDGKNEKYCYEKPVTTTTTIVPQIIMTGYQILTTTPVPAPVSCPSGCACYTLADGKQQGLPLCSKTMTLCGYDKNQQPEYCHQLPTTAAATTTLPALQSGITRIPVSVSSPTTITPVAPVSAVAVATRCFISGNIYHFYHNTSTLKVRFTSAGGTGSDVSVTPVFAGDLVDHYRYTGFASCNGVVEVEPVFRADPDVCPWTGTFTPSRGTTVTMTGESQDGWDFTYVSTDTNAPEVSVIFTPSAPAANEGVRVGVWGKDDMSITRMSAKYEGVRTDGTSFSQPWSALDPQRSIIQKAGDLPGWIDTFDISPQNTSRLTVMARVCDGAGNERWGSGTVQFGSCNDFIRNRDEEQIDCGGSFCAPCIPCTWCGSHVTPLHITGSTANKIDVIFIPDNDYGTDMAGFVRDIQDTIVNGYLRSDAIELNKTKFNFYYLDSEADVTGYPSAGFTPPLGSCENFQDATSFADSLPVVHKTDFRDWSDTRCERRVFCSEPTSYRTFVHESGHSVFGLKDEYCCDSHYSQNNPNPNIWSSQANCVNDATVMGWNTADCSNFCPSGSGNCGSGFWDIDSDVCIMTCSQSCNLCGAAGMCQFDDACLRRVNYVFSQYP